MPGERDDEGDHEADGTADGGVEERSGVGGLLGQQGLHGRLDSDRALAGDRLDARVERERERQRQPPLRARPRPLVHAGVGGERRCQAEPRHAGPAGPRTRGDALRPREVVAAVAPARIRQEEQPARHIVTVPGNHELYWDQNQAYYTDEIKKRHPGIDILIHQSLELEGVKLLLTGDLSAQYGQYAAVSADVVKAAHHGSKNGTTQAFLDESAPTAVLVSTKRENAADYLRGITDADVYSTLESGAIIIRMADGHFTIEEFEEMQ